MVIKENRENNHRLLEWKLESCIWISDNSLKNSTQGIDKIKFMTIKIFILVKIYLK